MNQPIDGHKYALQMMDDGEASGLDLDNLDEVRAFMDAFAQRVADRTGNDKIEVATAITAGMMLHGLIQDSDEAGRKIRAALIGYTTPAAHLHVGLDAVVRVCGGLPLGKDPDESGRLVQLASLTANDLRLMVFDMVAGVDHNAVADPYSAAQVITAASNAVVWIAALGDLTYKQWLDTQRDEDGHVVTGSVAKAAAARVKTEVAR